LICDGALDEGCVEDLAKRLGVGSRQLRRLFLEHLGISPAKIAIIHRLYSARHLIQETALPITQIAFSSGFATIRQFNHSLRLFCGQSPTKLRQARINIPPLPPCGLLARLKYRAPFAWRELLDYLRRRAIAGVELVDDRAYKRTISVGGLVGVIDVSLDENDQALIVRIDLPGIQKLIAVIERVRRIFDLDADPVCIERYLSRDPRLRLLVRHTPGLRIPGAWDSYELAVRAILGEQFVSARARALTATVVRIFGRPVQTSIPALTHLFPEPQDLIDADLSKAGLPVRYRAAVKAVARAACKGSLASSHSATVDQTISGLCEIRGISEITAHYIAMRLGEPDAFPFCGPASSRIGDAIRPWRSYAAMYLSAEDSLGKI
jgi:AraC family transcriptional regulator of adaptative response / DNA-3-methyladenine glycosylase II